MNILEQLQRSRDALEALGADDALVELGYVLGCEHGSKTCRLTCAVVAMRLAMDDPSCVDEIEPGTEKRGNTLLAGGSLHRDPTADAALVANTARAQHRDLVRAIDELHRAALAGRVKTATGKAYTVAGKVNRWLPRFATQKERLEAARDLEPGCVSCARTEVTRGVKRWEPRHRGDLCRWCDDWKRKHGESPSVEIVEQHHRGRVRVSA